MCKGRTRRYLRRGPTLPTILAPSRGGRSAGHRRPADEGFPAPNLPSEISTHVSPHAIWDICIIEKKLGTDPQTIAQDLLDGLPDSDRAAWIAVPIAGWANESFQVTRRKSVQYCVRVGTKCVYQQGNETFSAGEDEKVVIVNAAYLELHVTFVRDRLKRAGIRLGNLLNTTLGQ